jgi:hypothetical protein
MKKLSISILVLIGSLHLTSAVGQITQSVNSENTVEQERVHEFINHQYHKDEFLPHTLVLNYEKEQVEWYEPLTDWIGGRQLTK